MEELTIAVSIVSILLAIIAIVVALIVERRTADTLGEITTKVEVIEATVAGAQKQLLDTVTDMAKPPDPGTQFGLALMPQILSNPELLERLMRLGQMAEEDS